MKWLKQAKEEVIPSNIDEEMWEFLSDIGDDVGEEELSDGYILKYEGWGGECLPEEMAGGVEDEEACGYAADQTDSILKEWKQKLKGRAVFVDGGYQEGGLYGVTYALFRKIEPKGKKKR